MFSDQRSCIVLGGGGFIGINLCRRLLSDGWKVSVYGHASKFSRYPFYPPPQLFEGDFSDQDSVFNAIKTSNVVFHLIHTTSPHTANANMIYDVQSNVIPSISLLEACVKARVQRVVFLSSAGTLYGRFAQIPTPETDPVNPITSYGITKLTIEKYLGLYEYHHGLVSYILRASNPFGPFQIPNKGQGIIAKLLQNMMGDSPTELWGDGSVIRDFIYIDDLVDALVSAATNETDFRIFNIGSGLGLSINDVISTIERRAGKKLKIKRMEGRPVDVPVSVVDSSLAQRHLGWQPATKFEQGIQKTIDWWREK